MKVPLAVWFLFGVRAVASRSRLKSNRDWVIPVIVALFLLVAMLGSKRNYGFRYLLPMAVPAIVWTSALAEGGRWLRRLSALGLLGLAVTLALNHPRELVYFNELAGGTIGGRKILADSNLDWGQGAKSLARLQRTRPEFRDLTLFYFGDIDPARFGVEGVRVIFDANRTPAGLTPELQAETRYLAVSASLQWGPWGPPGYFASLDSLTPVAYTEDTSIAIYRTDDWRRSVLGRVKTGRAPE